MLATREVLPEFCKEFEKLNLGWVSNTEVITIEVDSTLKQDIQKGQHEDAKIQGIKEQINKKKAPRFSVDEQGMLLEAPLCSRCKRNQRVDFARSS
jgi:hypothetical protein